MAVRQTAEGLVFATTHERVALARRTHRQVGRVMVTTMGIVAAVVLIAGGYLSTIGRASWWGIVIVALAAIGAGFLMKFSSMRALRNAERYLASDGVTQFVLGADHLRIADVVVPYSQITYLYCNAGLEHYSDGGISGEIMAYRMDITDDRPTIGRGIGARIGTKLRRKLYRDGAKSGIQISIGIERKSEISAPAGMINELKLLPNRGVDTGRIDVPFGAFLSREDLQALLTAVAEITGGALFPSGFVSGDLNWASVQSNACESRTYIWEQHATVTAP